MEYRSSSLTTTANASFDASPTRFSFAHTDTAARRAEFTHSGPTHDAGDPLHHVRRSHLVSECPRNGLDRGIAEHLTGGTSLRMSTRMREMRRTMSSERPPMEKKFSRLPTWSADTPRTSAHGSATSS